MNKYFSLMEENKKAIEELQPAKVFQFFSELCSIPHGSSNTKMISDYLVNYAREHGYEYIQDKLNNVIIFVPAAKGYEDEETLIIQGHMDMVCEKKPGYETDMSTEGLKLVTDGKYLWGHNTTLGGDDGIAVAYALAVADSGDIKHPALELVITVDEEIGMLGAAGIDLSMLKGRKLLNIDSEEEGIFLTSCAGGLTLNCSIPVVRNNKEAVKYCINVEGLKGGHSGCEIDKGRANANILAGRLLYEIDNKIECNLIDINGGLKDNAIPRSTEVNILIEEKDKDLLEDIIINIQQEVKNEYKTADPDIMFRLTCKGREKCDVMCNESFKKVVNALMNMPNGIQSMSMDIEGLVETSLNLGILTTSNDDVKMCYSIRSSIESAKQYLKNRAEYFITSGLGGTASVSGDYTGWEYRKDSELRDRFIYNYKMLYGNEPKIEAIHAGLECGIFTSKIKDLDCISFGPDILNIHTFEEKLDVKSTERTWNLLLKVLEEKK